MKRYHCADIGFNGFLFLDIIVTLLAKHKCINIDTIFSQAINIIYPILLSTNIRYKLLKNE